MNAKLLLNCTNLFCYNVVIENAEILQKITLFSAIYTEKLDYNINLKPYN